jgi:hypothetical protein
MARATFVKKARKDIPSAGIKAGESYYWWKFRYGGKHFSKTEPRRSQLTQSSFYGSIYDLQDQIGAGSADESVRDLRDDVVSTLSDLKDECESNYDNIPDSLKEGSSGELLQERIQALETAIDEFESLDLDEDPEDDFDENEVPRDEFDTDEQYEARVETAKDEHVTAHWQGKLDELQAIDIEAP